MTERAREAARREAIDGLEAAVEQVESLQEKTISTFRALAIGVDAMVADLERGLDPRNTTTSLRSAAERTREKLIGLRAACRKAAQRP